MCFREPFNISFHNFRLVLALGKVCRVVNSAVLLLAIVFNMGCSEHQVRETKTTQLPQPDLKNGTKFYKVQPGDTLFSIGYRAGLNYRQLAEWNEIPPPYVIKVGQIIKLFKPKTVSKHPVATKKPSPSATKNTNIFQKNQVKSNSNKKQLKLYWQWPLKGRILRSYVQSGFKGIDIQGKKGELVRVAANGKVVYSGSGLKGYGNLLIIKHSEQYLSAYAHNRRLLVKEGQKVKSGQVIAEVGRNDMNKYVLHFEIRKNGKPVNPTAYLPAN